MYELDAPCSNQNKFYTVHERRYKLGLAYELDAMHMQVPARRHLTTAMAAAMTVQRGNGRARAVRRLGRGGEDANAVGDWQVGGAAFLF